MQKLIFLITCLLIAVPCLADTIYVDVNTPDNNDGSSWAKAYKYLQDALADANSNGDVNEIRVAEGIYKPDCNSTDFNGSGDRESTFQLINGVALRGGYAGFGAPDPNIRDIELYETILSGDLDGDDIQGLDPCDLLNDPNRGENSYHVVTASETDDTAVLDGFVVTAGNASGSYPLSEGGGIYCTNASPIITNCTIIRNSSVDFGGGIMFRYGSPTISNCTISRNLSSNWGGGGIMSAGSSLTISNCTISQNCVTGISGYGGGIQIVDDPCSTTISNCTISQNSASASGGGILSSNSSLILSDSVISDNSSGANAVILGGGGICVGNFGWLTIVNCTISNNSAYYSGGGIVVETGIVSIASSTIINNSSTYGGGGGVYFGLGILFNATNCTFRENAAVVGGGIYIEGGYFTVTNCTLSGNSADSNGGGIFDNGSYITLANSIFWDNTDDGPKDESAQIYRPDLVVDINNSCVYGWTGALGGIGNIGTDPLFVDPNGPDGIAGTLDDNLRLQPNSPCIDAGDNNSVPMDITDLDNDGNYVEPIPFDFDLNGFPRFIDDLCVTDTGNGTPPIMDMGAYEFLSSDIDSKGNVDFVDFCLFAAHWLDTDCGTCSGADLTCDGNVDFDDLRELVAYWLAGSP